MTRCELSSNTQPFFQRTNSARRIEATLLAQPHEVCLDIVAALARACAPGTEDARRSRARHCVQSGPTHWHESCRQCASWTITVHQTGGACAYVRTFRIVDIDRVAARGRFHRRHCRRGSLARRLFLGRGARALVRADKVHCDLHSAGMTSAVCLTFRFRYRGG